MIKVAKTEKKDQERKQDSEKNQKKKPSYGYQKTNNNK